MKPAQAIELKSLNGAVPLGATAVFAATEAASQPVRRVAVGVSRPLDDPDVQLALMLDDTLAAPSRSHDADPAQDGTPLPQPVFQRETVVLKKLPVGEKLSAALVVPFASTESRAKAVAFLIEVSPGTRDPQHVEIVDRCAADMARAASAAASRPGFAPLHAGALSVLPGAVARLDDPNSRRAALLYLSVESGAKLCGDVVLVAEDRVLAELATRVKSNAGKPEASTSLETLGWALDEATLKYLTELLAGNTLPAELSAVLAMHCGEAGRHPGSLDEVLRGANTRSVYEQRLEAENVIFLEDNSPASRVRAHDWLRAIGRAPENFDPLGTPIARREAIDRAVTASSTTQQAQP
jgi:hypothetical protein